MGWVGGLDEAQREKQQQQATTLSTSDKPRVADLPHSRSAAPQPRFSLPGSTAWIHDAWRWDGTSVLSCLSDPHRVHGFDLVAHLHCRGLIEF